MTINPAAIDAAMTAVYADTRSSDGVGTEVEAFSQFADAWGEANTPHDPPNLCGVCGHLMPPSLDLFEWFCRCPESACLTCHAKGHQ
jgi:hypothetical protein